MGRLVIAVVLDRSPSMDDIYDATMEGFNKFLDERQIRPGDSVMTLVQFDTSYEVTHELVPIKQVAPLDRETYVLQGMTALHDAIGKTIISLKDEVSEDDKVVFAVFTDGFENKSKIYDLQMIKNMIKYQSAAGWEFAFLAANQDAVLAGNEMNIRSSSTKTWSFDDDGIRDAFSSLDSGIERFSSGGTFNLSG